MNVDRGSNVENIDEQIETAFHSTELIIVFLTLFFTLRYPEIQADVDAKVPEGDVAKKNHKRKLMISMRAKCLPFVLVNSAVTYLYVPLLVRVIKNSRIDLWNFDFTRTSFFLIAATVIWFCLWSCSLAVQLLQRILQCNIKR